MLSHAAGGTVLNTTGTTATVPLSHLPTPPHLISAFVNTDQCITAESTLRFMRQLELEKVASAATVGADQ